MESLKPDSTANVDGTGVKSIKKRELLAIDVETTMRCTRTGFSSATPWDTSNVDLQIGVCWDDSPDATATVVMSGALEQWIRDNEVNNRKSYIYCGHNFKFDLHYIQKANKSLHETIVSNPIWDTSIAHYVLTGQRDKFPSLEEARARSAPTIPSKGDLIKRLIEEGKTTEDATFDELSDYLKSDCYITYMVALAQMAEARERGMLRLIYTMCSAMKAVQEIEFQGIRLDLIETGNARKSVDVALEAVEKLILNDVDEELRNTSDIADTDLVILRDCKEDWMGSTQFWSSFFFGGAYTLKYKRANGEWKSGVRKGLIRWKMETLTYVIHPIVNPASHGSIRGKSGYYALDDAVLTSIKNSPSEPTLAISIANALLIIRKLNKLQSTYLKSLPSKVWSEDLIHCNIHQTSTDTGRMSSSAPNMQNIITDDENRVKKLFIPRYPGGWFIEADYKQLEVVGLAWVTQDPNLLADIRSGIDIHDRVSQAVFGPSFTKDERRIVKTVNFGTIYGGGTETIARQSGFAENQVWEIRKAFFDRYRNVKVIRNLHIEQIQLAPSLHWQDDKGQRYGVLTSTTGRCYNIPLTKKIVSTGIRWEPYYTKVCNYPIQGLATGDIVPMMMAHVWKHIRKQEHPLVMVNQVHDSMLFETLCALSHEQVINLATDIRDTLEEAPAVFTHVFGHSFDLPLKVEVQYSSQSWGGPWITL